MTQRVEGSCTNMKWFSDSIIFISCPENLFKVQFSLDKRFEEFENICPKIICLISQQFCPRETGTFRIMVVSSNTLHGANLQVRKKVHKTLPYSWWV